MCINKIVFLIIKKQQLIIIFLTKFNIVIKRIRYFTTINNNTTISKFIGVIILN